MGIKLLSELACFETQIPEPSPVPLPNDKDRASGLQLFDSKWKVNKTPSSINSVARQNARGFSGSWKKILLFS